MKKVVWVFFPVFIIVLSSIYFFSISKKNLSPTEITLAEKENKITVFTTIPPLKFLVSKIAGSKANVFVMIKPGYNPHSYEPLPEQMKELSKTSLFFLVGLNFELSWLDKIKNSYPKINFIDTSSVIMPRKSETLIEIEAGGSHNHHHEKEFLDPHTWMSPENMRKISKLILETLIKTNPEEAAFFEKNFNLLISEIDKTDSLVRLNLSSAKNKSFMVFHPSFGYFADYYGLTQIPIEIEGKNPGSKELSKIIEIAKKENIKTVFTQTGFPQKDAEAVAEAISGTVQTIDHLSENYLENLIHISETIKRKAD